MLRGPSGWVFYSMNHGHTEGPGREGQNRFSFKHVNKETILGHKSFPMCLHHLRKPFWKGGFLL